MNMSRLLTRYIQYWHWRISCSTSPCGCRARLSLTIKDGIARLRLILTVIRPENDFYELVILGSTQLYMGTIKLHRKGTIFLHRGILYFYTTPYYKITLLPICYIDKGYYIFTPPYTCYNYSLYILTATVLRTLWIFVSLREKLPFIVVKLKSFTTFAKAMGIAVE